LAQPMEFGIDIRVTRHCGRQLREWAKVETEKESCRKRSG
jgi:hypothetical protein